MIWVEVIDGTVVRALSSTPPASLEDQTICTREHSSANFGGLPSPRCVVHVVQHIAIVVAVASLASLFARDTLKSSELLSVNLTLFQVT